MYLAGTFSNFEQRLHQLPISLAELNQFQTEGLSLTSQATSDMITRWDKEYEKKCLILSANTVTCVAIFSSGGGIPGDFDPGDFGGDFDT